MLAELKSIYDEKNELSHKLTEFADNFIPAQIDHTEQSNMSSTLQSPLSRIINNANLENSNDSMTYNNTERKNIGKHNSL